MKSDYFDIFYFIRIVKINLKQNSSKEVQVVVMLGMVCGVWCVVCGVRP